MLKIKSMREVLTAAPKTYCVTTDEAKIKSQPDRSIKEIKQEGEQYVAYSHTGRAMCSVPCVAVSVIYFQ